MFRDRFHNMKFAIGLVLAALTLCGIAVAQTQQVKGVINGPSGATMTLGSRFASARDFGAA